VARDRGDLAGSLEERHGHVVVAGDDEVESSAFMSAVRIAERHGIGELLGQAHDERMAEIELMSRHFQLGWALGAARRNNWALGEGRADCCYAHVASC
jgi:hypothetical protein